MSEPASPGPGPLSPTPSQTSQKRRLKLPQRNRVCGCLCYWPDDLQQRRARLFDFLEDPESSKFATYFSLFVLAVILVSIFAFVMETTKAGVSIAKPIRDAVEWFCTAVFTAELGLRFLVCNVYGSSGFQFVRNPLNIFDFLAVLPTYVDLITEVMKLGNQDGLSILRIGRLVRVLRLVKVARYTSGLHTMVEGLRRSLQALCLLLAAVLLGMILSSSMIYYAEYDTERVLVGVDADGEAVYEQRFKSIPASFWWAIVTMTTVGYGDFVPRTAAGKVIAGFTMLFGILLIALPMAIVGNKFQEVYEEMNAKKSAEHAPREGEFIGEATRRLAERQALLAERQAAAAAGAVLEAEDPSQTLAQRLAEALCDCHELHGELSTALGQVALGASELDKASKRVLSEIPHPSPPLAEPAPLDGTGGTMT